MLVICDVVGRTLAWILGALKLWSFGNVGNLWCLLDELWLAFWEHWNCDECGLACVIYGKILWVWVWKNYVGTENFLWICYFGYKNIFVGHVMLDHEKNFGYNFGYVGIFVVVHGHGHAGIFFDGMVMGKFW